MRHIWTQEEESDIRDLQRDKVPATEMAELFGVSYSTMLRKIRTMNGNQKSEISETTKTKTKTAEKTVKEEKKTVNFNEVRNVRRGEIYYIGSISSYGHEQQAGRPAIIVSNDIGNRESSIVEVVYLTTQEKTKMPTHVPIKSATRQSTALCEQIKTIDKARLGDYMGIISLEEQKALDKALAVSLAIEDCGDEERYTADNEELEALKAENERLKKELEKLSVNESGYSKETVRAEAERDVYKSLYEQLLAKVTG